MSSERQAVKLRLKNLIGQNVNGFKLTDKLGNGAYGCAYRGERLDGKLAAIKMMKKYDDAKDEVAALVDLKGTENVQKFYWFGEYAGLSAIASELLFLSVDKLASRNGTEEQPGPFRKETLQRILFQTVNVLESIHKKNYLHRDIKADNLVVSHPAGPNNTVKINLIDFGYASKFGKNKQIFVSVADLLHSSVSVMDANESRPIDDIIQLTYMSLHLCTGKFVDGSIPTDKLRTYKLQLINSPGVQLADSVIWLLPFFDAIGTQQDVYDVDYEKIKKALVECLPESDPSAELQMIQINTKWLLQ